MTDTRTPIDLCVIGDVHGHMQLALLMAARWQQELGITFDAVLLCGDVAAYADESRLDRATRRHARENPCDLELLRQWMTIPPAPWLDLIFAPVDRGGQGLSCPVVMVHGNHEDFALLESLTEDGTPSEPVPATELPKVDPGGRLSYLPSGWRTVTAGGATVGGIGGIQPGQRPKARYSPMAYISEDAVLAISEGPPVDVLITHQGPAELQGPMRGSDLLDVVLHAGIAKTWFHGHSVADYTVVQRGSTTVVPLNGVPFHARPPLAGEPGVDAWCWLSLGLEVPALVRERPRFWRELHQRRWVSLANGQLVAPQLARGIT